MSRRTFAEGKAIVARYEQSGLSQKKFAASIGMPLAAMRYWIARIRDLRKKELPKPPVRFLEVKARQLPVTSQKSLITLPGNISVQTDQLPPPEYLADLSAAFQKKLPC